ncbi:GntR family transcriptional regulator [Spirochaeta cellobiosiphila]|uniref:GntR family transcriptional regulator n=1 Tax=Spirochaeta cellobiosiphila TaxID=504483 RepID=UPI00146EDF6D|nr:GntR family transcriptional regulator [Spirochaeta cellobiosiphila]
MENWIIDDIMNGLQSGRYDVEEPLPSEHTMCARYSVPRITVRNAYNRLEDQGIVVSRQGKGRYLTPSKTPVHLDLWTGSSFSEKLMSQGLELDNRILIQKSCDYDRDIWKRLDLDGKEEQVYHIAIIRMIEDSPIAIHHSYLPIKYFPLVEEEAPTIKSMFRYFTTNGYTELKAVSVTMELSLPTSEEQELLCCPPLIPLLVLENCTHSKEVTPLQYTRILYRGDRFKYHIN